MTEESLHLRALAERVAAAYEQNASPRAVLLTGSAAEGTSDAYSDLDLILYHDDLPSDDQLAAAREPLRSDDYTRLADPTQDAFIELLSVQGVEVQCLHSTVAAWEREMATVLEEHQATTPIQKALGGLLDGIPLYGEELIRAWQAKAAAYPAALGRAMVAAHLSFFPLWAIQPRLATRDATLWRYQALVEASQNLLGVLAGLNCLYYSTFQFKRLGKFVERMQSAPRDLARRLDDLFVLDPEASALDLEALVAETVALVEAQMPDVDTSGVRRTLGRRSHPWT